MLVGFFDKRYRRRYYVPVLSELVRPLRRAALTTFYRGEGVYCPCCERGFRGFANWHCPGCGSHPRHRLLWLYLRLRWAELLGRPLRVVHFAPERCMERLFKGVGSWRYITVDLKEPGVRVRMDMTALGFAEGSVDVILCSHVLEHVRDDRRALAECARVLKVGGVAFMQVPQCTELEKTYEDARVVTPLEREKHFGQWDHLRRYGRDFSERLIGAGFGVTEERFGEELTELQGEGVLARYGLWRDRIYVCRKGEEVRRVGGDRVGVETLVVGG